LFTLVGVRQIEGRSSLTTLVKKLSEEAITPENYRTEFSLYHIFNPNLSLQDTFRNAMRHLTHGHFTSFEVPAVIPPKKAST
jgi:hypothetical protein